MNKSQGNHTQQTVNHFVSISGVNITEELQEQLLKSKRQLSKPKISRIEQILKLSQNKIYGLETHNQQLYFDSYFDSYPQTIINVIEDVASQKINIIINQLENQQLVVFPQHLKTNSKSADKVIYKIQNTGNDSNYDQNSLLEQSQCNSYISKGHSTDLPGIRSFLKNIQEKQRSVRNKVEKSYQIERQEKQKSIKHQQQIKVLKRTQQIRIQKEKQLQKRRMKQMEKSEMITKQQQFRQFVKKLNRHPRPLFELKEDEFNDKEAKQRDQIKSKIRQIKAKNKPIDGEQIRNHQKDYEKKKEILENERAERIQKLMAQRDIPLPEQIFKGQFYDQIEPEKDSSQIFKQRSKSVRQRINKFNEVIRQNYKPKIDQKKKQQLQHIIELERKRQKIKSSLSNYNSQSKELDSTTLGNKYLQQLKRLTPQIRNYKPQTTQSKATKTTQLVSNQKSVQIKRYLHNGARGLRQNPASWRSDLVSQNLTDQQKYQLVLNKADKLNVQAKRKQKLLKTQDKSTGKAFQLKESIDNYYINSIQAKLELMSKLGK